jgi:hypothetical protein
MLESWRSPVARVKSGGYKPLGKDYVSSPTATYLSAASAVAISTI